MISQKFQKVKEWTSENRGDLYITVVIFLVGLGSFGLGRLSVIWPQKEPITISKWGNPLGEEAEATVSQNKPQESPSGGVQAAAIINAKGKYVASKNGTAYHYPWCSGAQRIKEENKIYFNTKEEAEKAGYRPAANCDGL